MIKYALRCDVGHEFEAWFRDSKDYDKQAANALVICPHCGSVHVEKAIMAPAVARGGSITSKSSGDSAKAAAIQKELATAAKRARDYVEKNFDYVGDKFPEEARRIHYGETEERQIYGEATGKDVKELVDEGVQVAPVPQAPGEAKDKPPAKKLN